MPNKYLQIDGVATYVHHTGPTTLPEAPPVVEHGEAVVCLHGAGGNGNLFAELLGGLEQEHTLIAFDQPGHGRSGELDSLGEIGRMAAFTGRVLDALGLGPVVLVGHDMGAAVALRCALDRPEGVRALVVCSAGDRFELPDDVVEQMRRVRDGKERRPFDKGAFSSKAAPEIMKRAFMEGMKTDPRATFGDLVACREWSDAERLGSVAVPTLVVHGEDDREAVKTSAAALAERVPGARLETIPGAGHSLLIEAPGPLAERVRDFLAGLPS